jgi:hypothetical protein
MITALLVALCALIISVSGSALLMPRSRDLPTYPPREGEGE